MGRAVSVEGAGGTSSWQGVHPQQSASVEDGSCPEAVRRRADPCKITDVDEEQAAQPRAGRDWKRRRHSSRLLINLVQGDNNKYLT